MVMLQDVKRMICLKKKDARILLKTKQFSLMCFSLSAPELKDVFVIEITICVIFDILVVIIMGTIGLFY